MRVLRADSTAPWPRGGVLTIGNYDGVHRGQRRVLERLVARARELGAPALLLTFEPHPLTLLDPARAPRRLTTDAQRERLLDAAGLEALLILPFTAELAAMAAPEFVRQVLVERLAVREVHVGSRFAFGRGRGGSLALLERMGAEAGFAAVGIDELAEGGAPVSATRIREAVAAGEIEAANSLLGRLYAVEGTIAAGERLGRRLGWPTANLEAPQALLPANGVYAAKLSRLDANRTLEGVANVGIRPTRGGDPAARVEIHLFDFAEEIYGERVEISFARRLRAERRFDTLEALSEQIARDAADAREYFRRPARSERGAAGRGAPDGGQS